MPEQPPPRATLLRSIGLVLLLIAVAAFLVSRLMLDATGSPNVGAGFVRLIALGSGIAGLIAVIAWLFTRR